LQAAVATTGARSGRCAVGLGVTQRLIDETRLAPENIMLSDMQSIVNVGGDIQYRGAHGETPVRRLHFPSVHRVSEKRSTFDLL